MKNKLIYTIAAFIFTLSSFTSVRAQKYTEGDKTLSFLRGEKEINLEYNYDNMTVGKKTEEQYKSEKIADYNKKQRGKGERWAEKWTGSRTLSYEPMFEELINKIFMKAKLDIVAAKNNDKAKYTLKVHTVFTEPGWNAGIMKSDPYCNFVITWIEKESGKEMAKANLDRVPGHVAFDNDWEFDQSTRIKECYAKAGKMIAKHIEKMMKK